LNNYIDEKGQYHPRGEVLDDSVLPEHIRNNPQLVGDLDTREGRVMLLRGVTFTSYRYDPLNKCQVGFPCTLTAGEALKLEDIPERQRSDWQEGVQYKTDWTLDEQRRLRHETNEEYLAQFQPDPLPLGIYNR
jgi:hypothetical protein